jgi:hypothetical protein
MSEALQALDAILYEASGGAIVRGGALTASPNEVVRQRIREFKRLNALREQEGESQPLRRIRRPRSLKDIIKAKPRRRVSWK